MSGMNEYQKVIALSRYARYKPELDRRETWEETVKRYIDFFKDHITSNYPKAYKHIPWDDLYLAILNMEIMPSMRCMMTAGPALERDHVAGYNCAYSPIDSLRAFDEAMYILMCGTGLGFSVESKYVNKLPEVPDEFTRTESVIVVADSKIGWASAYRELLGSLFNGIIPSYDLSRIRRAGTPLRTMGGRASGPEPLEDLFRFTIATVTGAKGRRLTTLECHDLMCKIAEIVVVGGVRRSALLSLTDLNDDKMRYAKSGEWWIQNPQRQLANISVAYGDRPELTTFMKEWLALYESKSGERGIFNRGVIRSDGNGSRRDLSYEFGTNPCSEIILRPHQFCNLSEIVARQADDATTLTRKAVLATILGTLQSTLTSFRYLRKSWQTNTEEERLLGVSLTGIYDCGILDSILEDLKDVCIRTNAEYADKLAIPRSAAITCVKPSGTVSQLVNCASGIHPHYAEYYIRRVRFDSKDPMARFMIEQGVPYEKDISNPLAVIFSFTITSSGSPASSDKVVSRKDVSAIAQLEKALLFQNRWCEHKVSMTCYVRESEWLMVGAWVYGHFDALAGIAFLPYDSGTYRQAPYEEITADEYEVAKASEKKVDWTLMKEYDDETTGSQELACIAGACEF